MKFVKRRMMPASFLRVDSGAVTTEFQIISSGLLTITLAVSVIVFSATRSTTGSIRERLICRVTSMICNGETFNNGAAAGWTNSKGKDAIVSQWFGFDEYDYVLGPFAGNTGSEKGAYKDFVIPEGTSSVTLSMDILASGSFDNSVAYGLQEGPRLYVDGTEVARGYLKTSDGWVWETQEGYSITETVAKWGDLGGGADGGATDLVSNVRLTIENPQSGTLTLGVGAHSNGEQVAYDNIKIQTS